MQNQGVDADRRVQKAGALQSSNLSRLSSRYAPYSLRWSAGLSRALSLTGLGAGLSTGLSNLPTRDISDRGGSVRAKVAIPFDRTIGRSTPPLQELHIIAA